MYKYKERVLKFSPWISSIGFLSGITFIFLLLVLSLFFFLETSQIFLHSESEPELSVGELFTFQPFQSFDIDSTIVCLDGVLGYQLLERAGLEAEIEPSCELGSKSRSILETLFFLDIVSKNQRFRSELDMSDLHIPDRLKSILRDPLYFLNRIEVLRLENCPEPTALACLSDGVIYLGDALWQFSVVERALTVLHEIWHTFSSHPVHVKCLSPPFHVYPLGACDESLKLPYIGSYGLEVILTQIWSEHPFFSKKDRSRLKSFASNSIKNRFTSTVNTVNKPDLFTLNKNSQLLWHHPFLPIYQIDSLSYEFENILPIDFDNRFIVLAEGEGSSNLLFTLDEREVTNVVSEYRPKQLTYFPHRGVPKLHMITKEGGLFVYDYFEEAYRWRQRHIRAQSQELINPVDPRDQWIHSNIILPEESVGSIVFSRSGNSVRSFMLLGRSLYDVTYRPKRPILAGVESVFNALEFEGFFSIDRNQLVSYVSFDNRGMNLDPLTAWGRVKKVEDTLMGPFYKTFDGSLKSAHSDFFLSNVKDFHFQNSYSLLDSFFSKSGGPEHCDMTDWILDPWKGWPVGIYNETLVFEIPFLDEPCVHVQFKKTPKKVYFKPISRSRVDSEKLLWHLVIDFPDGQVVLAPYSGEIAVDSSSDLR